MLLVIGSLLLFPKQREFPKFFTFRARDKVGSPIFAVSTFILSMDSCIGSKQCYLPHLFKRLQDSSTNLQQCPSPVQVMERGTHEYFARNK